MDNIIQQEVEAFGENLIGDYLMKTQLLAQKETSTKNLHLIPINSQKGFVLLSMMIFFFALTTLAYSSFIITKSYNLKIENQMKADRCSLVVSASKAKIFTKIKLLNNRIKELHIAIGGLRAAMIAFPPDALALKSQEETLKGFLQIAIRAQKTLINTSMMQILAYIAADFETQNCLRSGFYENYSETFSLTSMKRTTNPALPDLEGWLDWKSRCPDRDEKVVYVIPMKAKSATTSVKKESLGSQIYQARFIRDLQDETYECGNNNE